MSKILILDNLRIVPRESEFLNRKTGSRGEIFYDRETNSLRLFDGVTQGGVGLAKNDLSNIANDIFKSKANEAGIIAATSIGDNPPEAPQTGQLWFDIDDGSLYIFYNDGNSTQWVQPAFVSFGGSSGEGGSSSLSGLVDVTISSPNIGQALIYNGTVWTNSGVASSSNTYSTFAVSGQNSVVADNTSDTLTLIAGNGISITTNSTTDSITITNSATAGNNFGVIQVSGQDNLTADTDESTLVIQAGSGITLSTNNNTNTLTITASGSVNSINDLTDVDTSSSPPQTGNVLKWNGTNWAPGIDATIGGSGTDADTLDGFDSSYFLNYNNLNNKPSIPSAIFSTISVAGQTNILADTATDTLTFVAGSGITITTNAVTDTITITNSLTDNDTTYSLSAETADAGVNLRLTGSDTVTDDVKFAAGNNVTVTRTDANTITISATSTATNSFNTISVSGQSNVVADSSTDTLTYIAGTGISITTNESTDSITFSSTSNVFSTIAVSGQNNIVADSLTDTLTLAAGTGISIITDSDTDTITITNSVNVPNGFSTVAITGQDSIAAASTTDSFTISGGTGISISSNASTKEITITNSQSPGATAFTGLSDVTTAQLDVSKIYLPAITMLKVDNSGASAYLFDQYTGNNPTIYAISGTTIAFDLTEVPGHPFLIQDGTSADYNTGLIHVATNGTVSEGANAQGKDSGVLYWKIPAGISGGYRYQCSAHGAMVGSITVKGIVSI